MADFPDTRHTRAELLARGAALLAALAGLRAFRPADAVAAAGPTLLARDEPLDGGRALLGSARVLAPREASPFDLLGLHWQGAGRVFFRTRSDGAWGAWHEAVEHERAEPGEGGVRGLRLGTPFWTPGSDAVQYRLDGPVRRLRAHFVRSPAVARRLPATAAEPFVITRAAWGADETIVRGEPAYAPRLRLAFVHHTAGSTPKTPDESAAIVRAIQIYHVESNGWNDIGYNFLVDPFGQVFEGRAGGIERNVIGAHALGHNTGTTGISLLGNFESRDLTTEARAALTGLLAWRLDVGHVDPLATVTYVSDGRSETLRAVSGHRDVNSTACPGRNLYAELDGLASEAAAIGLPKLYNPSVNTSADGAVTFRARLSEARSWSVTVTDRKGGLVASGAGAGQAVLWRWQAGSATGTYRYSIEAGADVRPAAGRFTLGEPPEPEPPPPRPPRPDGVPRRIPAWAWQLRRWHLTPKDERGERPAAPRPLPAWYWPWFRWQSELKEWQEQYGRR